MQLSIIARLVEVYLKPKGSVQVAAAVKVLCSDYVLVGTVHVSERDAYPALPTLT